MKKISAVLGAVLSAVYLSNVGAGIVELLPDNIPVAGNIDEIIASIILLRCLVYLGFDPLSLREKVMRNVTKRPEHPPAKGSEPPKIEE